MSTPDPTGHQSPIDLTAGAPLDAPRLAADYLSGRCTLTHTGTTLSVVPEDGGALWAGSRRFELVELHFHHPSEHTEKGVQAAAEAHFVHTDDDGKTGVLGVLLEEGAENEQLAVLLEDLPAPGAPAREGVRFDPLGLLPRSLASWRYDGSLTTPPYTSGVAWMVLEDHATASAAQLAALGAAFPDNARPVQPRAGRSLWRCA